MIRKLVRAVFAWICTPVVYLLLVPVFILLEFLIDGNFMVVRDTITAHWRWSTFREFNEV